ncbi:GNAT family N-acetyltransferase [Massilia rubra]|uniref:GNAT family N-acetyltransferase n=1 Tax=Massilia rubra TaxID=2607910 RepID=A0ABX0M3Y3_9BURK|nr:GNAT family protein [Massilia rubra]NHZ38314.1 GNAT family N-acetyltransferase [Massilia rubra]
MIKGSNFVIRHIILSDLPALVPLLNDPDIRGEYLPSAIHSPIDLERRIQDDGMANDGLVRLVIVEQSGNTIIGTIWHSKAVPYFNAREIGYTLSNECRGRGFATEAVNLLVRYLFNSTLINRIEIRMDARNLASEKVAIKCGFQKEGVSRGANFVRGNHVDMNLYALLRHEVAG